MISRYALFVWDTYYPNGGWDDFKCYVEDPMKVAGVIGYCDSGAYHVVDLHTGKIVNSGDIEGLELK